MAEIYLYISLMIDSNTLHKIKRLTISALVSDSTFMGILVLKGGNALDLAYEISNRASIDIDFSMEKDFTQKERNSLLNKITDLLTVEFSREDLVPFDIRLSDKPNKVNDAVKSFWGGYMLEFKVISREQFDRFGSDIESVRRNALPLHTDNSSKFTVDISKYEYVADKRAKDIEGAVVYVYSPEMLALEKLRALCQQNLGYREVIYSMTSKSRARDFYDIYNLAETFSINFQSPENIGLCRQIFAAKHVPLSYIPLIAEQKEFHRQSWESVISTVNQREMLRDFDFYFDYVIRLFNHLH